MIINVMLLAISMAACLFDGVLKKYITVSRKVTDSFNYLYNTVTAFTVMAVLCIWNALEGGSFSVSPFTVFLAIFFGFATVSQFLFQIKAFSCGPLAYTTMICGLSMIIPTLSGAIFWHEKVAPVQYVGILFMALCIVISALSGGEIKGEKASRKWLFFSGVLFLSTGTIGVIQKIHQTSPYKDELAMFLIISFAVSFVFSLIMLILSGKSVNEITGGSGFAKKVLPLMILCGVFAATNNKLNLFLLGVIPTVVFFPIVNGGHLILTTLFAVIVFKEKLGRKKLVGMIAGFVAIILLCNPF